ncbi:hypothetical protein OHA60_06650 [Streptomyces cellulosae]|jgi:hypothetical protein|nr:hypothetical protein OHA60_06650 [Streptomyces cellulosae]
MATADHQHRRLGRGAAVHVVLRSNFTACGRTGEYGEPVTTGATCMTCERRAPELMGPIPAKPKAKKSKAKKAAAPKKRTEATKVFASPKHADTATKIPGVRWAAVVRKTGSFTASVNAAEHGLIDAPEPWFALCVTHDQHSDFLHTHREAWEARRRPWEWCDDCKEGAK